MRIKAYIKKAISTLTLINELIPKNKKNILFYSNLGFRDNVRSVYDYMVETGINEKYRISCCVDDWRKYKGNVPDSVSILPSWMGLFRYLTSKYVFYSFGQIPIKPAKSQVVVHLWHGMPFKNLGKLEKGLEKEDFNYFTYITATSEHFGAVMKKAFACEDSQILYTGQPRNRVLIEADTCEKTKMILWMPTFRASDRLGHVDDECSDYILAPCVKSMNQWARLDAVLGEYGYNMIIRLHPMQNVSAVDFDFKNIKLYDYSKAGNDNDNLQRMYLKAAALITDYSSAMFDYLLLDRPIGFTIEDYDVFETNRGFTVDEPLSMMAGEKITDFESLVEFCLSVINGEDHWRRERRAMNIKLNEYQNVQPVLQLLDKIDFER